MTNGTFSTHFSYNKEFKLHPVEEATIKGELEYIHKNVESAIKVLLAGMKVV